VAGTTEKQVHKRKDPRELLQKTNRLSYLEKLDECERHLPGFWFFHGERWFANPVLV
jgi:hypothetical protein